MATQNKLSLLASPARIQIPWVKVTIGEYTFGVFDKKTKNQVKTDGNGFFKAYSIQYPNYIKSLNIIKINGQVNQYDLQITYPVTLNDDPNFFEKVFSSVSTTRKIVFSYGDASMPSYIYKDEEAIITDIAQSFNLEASTIDYQIKAISSSVLGQMGTFTFPSPGTKKPSTIIKEIFKNSTYGLNKLFTGMSISNLDDFIEGGDRRVEISTLRRR